MSDIFKDIENEFPLDSLVDVKLVDRYDGSTEEFSGVVTGIMRVYDKFKILIDCPDKDVEVSIESEYVKRNRKYERERILKDLLD